MKTIQPVNISFYLNDQPIQITVDPDLTALQLIRGQLGLPGTKESCAEGDCGSCTVAVGAWEGERFVYRAKTACIMPAIQLHGRHLITIEGMLDAGKLHLIQQTMFNHHAIQCGYCSPGMVMSLFCLFASQPDASKEDILFALEGNLCRCTGYASIIDAAEEVAEHLKANIKTWQDEIFPSCAKTVPDKLKTIAPITEAAQHESPLKGVTKSYHVPHTMDELFALMDQYAGKFCFIAGGTDLMVNAHLYDEYYDHLIDLTRIPELNKIEKEDGYIVVGAVTTMAEQLEHPLVQQKLPGLCKALSMMGSKQIRNMATLGGNIGTAAPVADGTCAVLGLGAILQLRSKQAERTMPLEDFFVDYRKTALQPDEVIVGVKIPIVTGYCGFEKATKRLTVGISKLCSFVSLELDTNNQIKHCRIAFGGAQPFPAIAKQTMQELVGKTLKPDKFDEIARAVYEEFQSYVNRRSEPVYRRRVITNHMIRHLQRALQLNV